MANIFTLLQLYTTINKSINSDIVIFIWFPVKKTFYSHLGYKCHRILS